MKIAFPFRFKFRMATAVDNVVRSDHVIIWLDKNMGVPENNKSSKKILDDNANLNRSPSD